MRTTGSHEEVPRRDGGWSCDGKMGRGKMYQEKGTEVEVLQRVSWSAASRWPVETPPRAALVLETDYPRLQLQDPIALTCTICR